MRLLTELPDPDYGEGFPYKDELIGQLEIALVGVLDWISTDDLETISDAVGCCWIGYFTVGSNRG